jgi:hypothetical protein
MNTNHPTTTIYFVFAFIFCKVRVYVTDEAFLRKILEMNKDIELVEKEHDDTYYKEIDPQILTSIFMGSLKNLLGRLDEIARSSAEIQQMLKQAGQ